MYLMCTNAALIHAMEVFLLWSELFTLFYFYWIVSTVGLSAGADAGIAIAVIVGLVVIGVIVFLAVSGQTKFSCNFLSRGRSSAGFSPLSTNNQDDDDDDDALLSEE